MSIASTTSTSKASGVYLGMTFAPNHNGMPHPAGDEDYLRKQVLTSRNVRGGRFTDIALGGLNYQIEHHLFPGMPTPNLRKAQPIVRQYCADIGVPYEETSLVASYRQALRYLHEWAPRCAWHAPDYRVSRSCATLTKLQY